MMSSSYIFTGTHALFMFHFVQLFDSGRGLLDDHSRQNVNFSFPYSIYTVGSRRVWNFECYPDTLSTISILALILHQAEKEHWSLNYLLAASYPCRTILTYLTYDFDVCSPALDMSGLGWVLFR